MTYNVFLKLHQSDFIAYRNRRNQDDYVPTIGDLVLQTQNDWDNVQGRLMVQGQGGNSFHLYSVYVDDIQEATDVPGAILQGAWQFYVGLPVGQNYKVNEDGSIDFDTVEGVAEVPTNDDLKDFMPDEQGGGRPPTFRPEDFNIIAGQAERIF